MPHPLIAYMAPWYLRGKVIHGHGRGGTKLGYPTANIELNPATVTQLQPFSNLVLFGYGCVEPPTPAESGLGIGPYPVAMSIGYNPQFQDVALSCEAHFMHKIPEDFYGQVVRIIALGVIREQAAFTSLEALIETIDGDILKIRELLKRPDLATFEKHPFVQVDTSLPAAAVDSLPYFLQEAPGGGRTWEMV